MKQKKKINWWGVLAIILIGIPVGFVGMFFVEHSGDDKTDGEDIVIKDPTENEREAFLELDSGSLVFENDGGIKMIDIHSNVDWRLRVDDEGLGWLTATPNDGSGDKSLSVEVTTNDYATERTATIKVIWADGNADEQEETIRVVQHAKDDQVLPNPVVIDTPTPPTEHSRLSVSPSSVTFDATGGVKTFSVNSNVDWKITGGDSTWLTVEDTEGNGHKIITLKALENTSSTQRRASLTINWTNDGGSMRSTTVNVRQKEATPQPTSKFSVQPANLLFTTNGGSKNVFVNSNTDWTVSVEGGSWLTLDTTSGSRNKTINVRADKNTSTDSRSASLRFVWNDEQGQGLTAVVSVTQTGADPLPVAFLNASPSTVAFNASAGSKPVSVSSNTNWTVNVAGGDLLSVNVTSGNRNKTITLKSVKNNTANARSATLNFSWNDEHGETRCTVVSVSQQGVEGISKAEVQNIVAVGQKSSMVPDDCVVVVNGKRTTNYLNFRNGVKLGSYSNIKVTNVEGSTSGVEKIVVEAMVKSDDE